MGVYLNSTSPYMLYHEEFSSTYFVDKTEILKELVPLAKPEEHAVGASKGKGGRGIKYVCITRPRRFGKRTMLSGMR